MLSCFHKLRLETRKLDEGISKMEKIWKSPHIHIGRSYTRYIVNKENTEHSEEESEANAAAEALSKSVAEIKGSLIDDLENSEKNLVEMRQFMEDSRLIYEDLQQQCADIEILFTENGYVPEPNEIYVNDGEGNANGTISDSSEKQIVESTPYVPWKSKLKTFDASTPEINGHLIKKEPGEDLVKNLEISLRERCLISRSNINHTPYRQSPQEPVFSQHYYDLLEKKEIL